jgi:hypothetical protein
MFDNVSDEVRRPLTDQIPMNRMGLAEEVATPALFLASPDSTLVTGAEPCVDGGHDCPTRVVRERSWFPQPISLPLTERLIILVHMTRSHIRSIIRADTLPAG